MKRCGVYTRKSSEEGLEQDFNSLDAQREACLAYIQSQKSEGWVPIKNVYDDGGYSGGNVQRPGLQALMQDIKAGKINIIVVYKIDRLTRSLMDFAKLVEIFDRHEVTFVSVTQSFNTTTSMGRLTLNVLLSFAQFEREVTSERIRDKFAASKKKGIWMGGNVPMGYQVKERKLIVVPDEAETVQHIFKRYLELGSVRLLKTDLQEKCVISKRTNSLFSKSGLYHLLANPIYIGKLRHKGNIYDGQQEAIIEQELFDKVQLQMKELAPKIREKSRKTESSLLVGKLFDEAGEALGPTHGNKHGKRYRYYVSRSIISGETKEGWRLPAHEIEQVVIESARSILSDPHAITSAIQEADINPSTIPVIIKAAAEVNVANAIREILERATLKIDGITIKLILNSLLPKDVTPPLTVTKFIPMQIKRRGVEMRMVIESSSAAGNIDQSLIKAIARGHKWFGELGSGQVKSISEIANREKIDKGYVSHIINLAFLAPAVVERVIAGKQPADFTPFMLMKKMDIALNWSEQAKILAQSSH